MRKSCWILLAAAFAICATLHAQSITGDLVVNVTDPSGAVVSAAKLELTAVETNVKFEGQSDTLGNALFSQLKPGPYKLDVTAPGFQKATVTDIVIAIGERARVDAKLTVGTVAETVEVSAAAETLLNSESASLGQVIKSQSIVELPLNGRNFIQLAQISAGAAPIGIGVSPATSWTGRSDSTLSLAGGRETNNSFLVNGIETRNSRFGSAGIRPSAEAIDEFRVQRSTFGAEFGRSSAIINTTIRSGSNDLHVTLFEFLRNRNADANDFFANRTGSRKPPFTQNNFGTAVGGPVRVPGYDGKNKTFWFFNYEGFRQRQANTATGLYPSSAQMAGNLADDSAGTGIFPLGSSLCQANPTSRKCHDAIDPFSGQPFANNVIPTSRLDPIVQKQLPYQPKPNVGVTPNSPGFPNFNTVGFPKKVNDWDQYNVRLDHHFSSNDILYGTFSDSNETLLNPALRPLGGDVYPQTDRLYTVTYTRIISPTKINEFRFGFNRSLTYRTAETSNTQDYASQVFGLKNTSPNPFDFGVPNFNPTGFNGVGSLSEAIGATDENIQFTDNFSWNTPKHNIRVGLTISRQRYDEITDFSGNPSFNFDGRFTGMQGLGLGDMLLGLPISASGALGDSSQFLRTTYYSGYVQDDWRITPSLTLNFGLRYEYAASPAETRGKALVFAPDLGTVVYANHGVRPSIVDPDWNNFAPRFGFAYRPSFAKNTVVRGGFGIFYATDNFNEEQFKVIGPPFYQSQTLNSDPTKPTLLMSNMLPSFAASPNLNPFSFDRHNRTPYLSQWSFGIQQSFKRDYLFEVEYAGSTGQKLPERRNLNIGRLDPTGTIPIAARVPFPAYGFVLLTYNGGWSSYNALTTRLEKTFSNGLYMLASYTWEKSLDLGATDEFSAVSADFKKFDKGISTFDVPHRFVYSYVYELPLGRGKRFGGSANPALSKIIGGWQATGITTFSMGQFQTPSLGVDWLNLGSFTTSRPDIIGDYKSGRSFPDAYLSPAAFARPATHVEGNAARGSVEQPGINNWDLGIVKNTRVRERFNAQFRWEMFNAWNHTQFGTATLSLASANFGKIGGTLVGPRRMQFGLRLIY
ncbi:MAG TPA: carboxypeptidase regulatory-like domain-containing protein [Bryobacterales bacterium]|nr:carboxypeptidase regulatory-like domain-containing protein [Bryobacterales bacterium]